MKRLILAALTSSLALGALAEAPELFRYQGRLVDGNTLVNATLPMSFKLFDSATGGHLLYEDSSSVLVVDGLYATYIGDDTTAGNLTAALTNASVFLEVTIDGETLTPREQLTSVPYALSAKADSTPAGTIVLSPTFPNTELEAQGFSIYYEDVTQADWEGFYDVPYMDSYSTHVFSFGNNLGLYSASSPSEKDVFLTEDGKKWKEGRCPLDFDSASGLDIIEFNGSLFFFDSYGKVCSTTDLESWNTWTNQFGTSEMDTYRTDDILVFDDAIWAFTTHELDYAKQIMRSMDGINWTRISDGAAWSMNTEQGKVFASDSKLYVSAYDNSSMSNLVWSSSDGISWHTSTSTVPSGSSYGTELIHHDSALWGFFRNDSGYPYTGECWKSLDDGDSWALVSSNIPNYTISQKYKVISYADNMWLWGADDGSMDGGIFFSQDATDGTKVFDRDYMSEAATLVGLPNGKLWFYAAGDGMYGPNLYSVGGPKEEDGLYYYQKD